MVGEKLSPIRKFLSNRTSKKSLLYFSIVILTGLICLGLSWHFSKIPEIKEIPLPKPEIKEEESIKEVLERLTPPGEQPMTEK